MNTPTVRAYPLPTAPEQNRLTPVRRSGTHFLLLWFATGILVGCSQPHAATGRLIQATSSLDGGAGVEAGWTTTGCQVSGSGQDTYVNVTCSVPFRVANLRYADALSGQAGQPLSVPANSLVGVKQGEKTYYVLAAGQRTVSLNAMTSENELLIHAASLALSQNRAVDGPNAAIANMVGVDVTETWDGQTFTYRFVNPKLGAVVFVRRSYGQQPVYTILGPRGTGLDLIGGVVTKWVSGLDVVSSTASDEKVPSVEVCAASDLAATAGVMGPVMAVTSCGSLAPVSKLQSVWSTAMSSPSRRSDFLAANVADLYFITVRLAFELLQLGGDVDETGFTPCLLALNEAAAVPAFTEDIVPRLAQDYLNGRIPDVVALAGNVEEELKQSMLNPAFWVGASPSCLNLSCNAAVVAPPVLALCKATTTIIDAIKNGASLAADLVDLCTFGVGDFMDNSEYDDRTLPLVGSYACNTTVGTGGTGGNGTGGQPSAPGTGGGAGRDEAIGTGGSPSSGGTVGAAGAGGTGAIPASTGASGGAEAGGTAGDLGSSGGAGGNSTSPSCVSSVTILDSSWTDTPSGCPTWSITMNVNTTKGDLHCLMVGRVSGSNEFSASEIYVKNGVQTVSATPSCGTPGGTQIEAVLGCECSGTAYIQSHQRDLLNQTADLSKLVGYLRGTHPLK